MAPVGHLAVGAREHRDPGLGEQRGDGGRGPLAEDRQWLLLGRDDADRQLDVHLIRAGGRHQRELIDRQRPGHARRDHEREVVDVAAVDILEQPAHLLIQTRVVKRHGFREARLRPGAERQQDRVVPDLRAGLGAQRARVRIDRREGLGDQRGAQVGRDLADGVALRGAVGERLTHGQGPVDEVRVRRDQRHIEALGAKLAERKQRLECRDAAARDHDLEGF